MTKNRCRVSDLRSGIAGMRSGLIRVGVLLAITSGCGEFGGGASIVPRITFLPAENAVATNAAGSAGIAAETSATPGATGSIKGRVVLAGGSGPSLPLAVKAGAAIKDPEVCAAIDLADERLVVSSDNGVANVFVYLAKAPKGTQLPAANAEPFLFDQKNCRFTPHASIVPVGQTVNVLSADGVAHNTHTNPQKNDAVNSGVAPNDREGKLSFAYRKAEGVPFPVTCDFHGWMRAWHLPVDHPFAVVSDANGDFSIANLPAGKHSFVVWHESVKGNYINRKLTVEIKPGETADVKIDLPVSSLEFK